MNHILFLKDERHLDKVFQGSEYPLRHYEIFWNINILWNVCKFFDLEIIQLLMRIR